MMTRSANLTNSRALVGRVMLTGALLAGTALATPVQARDAGASLPEAILLTAAAPDAGAPPAADAPPADAPKEIVITGSLGALPVKNVGSVFGFDKTLVETPRSASTISKEQMDRFGITQIYDLVSQVPGTFTSSFFGTGGALDIRGAPSDVYFRGMLRLDNPGNYATPIGAADRIDIVRGPASVIYGPSKIGGYMNFVPKTARAASGAYASEAKGDLEVDLGSWGRRIIKGSVTGPGKIGDHQFGYSLYGEVEDSNSYYRNVHTKNALFSAAFDTDITDRLRTEFGYTYQNYDGVQNSGWNRLTQNLIDTGTYITGQAANLAAPGAPSFTREEAYAANGGNGLTQFFGPYCNEGLTTSQCFQANPDLTLTKNVGTTHLSMRDTLTGPNDLNDNLQQTAYFDLIWKGNGELKITDSSFYDGGVSLNQNAYGFSQAFSSYVMENKLVLSDNWTTALGKVSIQLSPSIRYTHFVMNDDFGAEFWNRPDISVDSTDLYQPWDSRLLSTQCNCDYSDFLKGHYLDVGMAGLVDVDTTVGLDFIGGLRYDHVHSTSAAVLSLYDPTGIPAIPSATDNEGGVSWSASASYKSSVGLIPYITASSQLSVVAGEGSELQPSNIAGGEVMGRSDLLEGGIKGEFLERKLYAAVSVYKQKRTQAGAESQLTNQILQTKGVEAEMRWSVDRHLLVTGSFTHLQVINLSLLNNPNGYFNYFGAGNYPGVNPALIFGGSEIGLIFANTPDKAERPGEPKNIVSGTATYAFDNGIALNGDISHVDAVFSDYTQQIRLPAYWLADAGVSYTTGAWLFRVVVKNVNNARYFRASGQDIFGADIVLPQLPRYFQASIKYKF